MKTRKIRWIVLPLVISGMIVFINHADPARVNRKTSTLSIQQEGGYNGHEIIGVQEESLPTHHDLLRFKDLAEWTNPDKSPCPEKIRKKSGTDATIIGFMYPLQSGSTMKTFCLLRSTQTCCYGLRPQFSQYLLVEMTEPVRFERLMPIMVKGKFIVDPKMEEGYIYRMEGQRILTPGQKEYENYMQHNADPLTQDD